MTLRKTLRQLFLAGAGARNCRSLTIERLEDRTVADANPLSMPSTGTIGSADVGIIVPLPPPPPPAPSLGDEIGPITGSAIEHRFFSIVDRTLLTTLSTPVDPNNPNLEIGDGVPDMIIVSDPNSSAPGTVVDADTLVGDGSVAGNVLSNPVLLPGFVGGLDSPTVPGGTGSDPVPGGTGKDTATELIQYMANQGLQFAPAQGDEAAYR